MAGAPGISIVIPTRNRRALLAETIDSILVQTLTDWELIVVDDHSEDDTFSYVKGLADDRITVVRLEQHAERSAARNMGLDLARGEFVFFLDDDDLLVESSLRDHVEALERHPEAIASVGNFEQFDERGARQLSKFVASRQEGNVWPDVLMGWGPACGRCVFRTLAVKSAKGWDVTYNICEDQELWLRLSRLGPVVLLPETVYRYRVHSGQWRPPRPEVQKLQITMREDAVKRLHGSERRRAERILAAQEQWRMAMRQYRDAKPYRALARFLNAVRLFPGILRLPVMGPKLRRRMMRCLIGGEAVVTWWRRVRGRNVRKIDYSGRTVEGSSRGRVQLGEAAPAASHNDEDD